MKSKRAAVLFALLVAALYAVKVPFSMLLMG